MNENDLSKSKILNINDFIFKQNLKFYPNLNNLKCQGNILIYTVNGQIVASEPLTFDLRTLPGHVWTYTSDQFLDVIRLNKKIAKLYDFIDIINEYSYEPFIPPQNEITEFELKRIVKEMTDLYFETLENNDLTESNKMLRERVSIMMQETPKNYPLGIEIDKQLINFENKNKGTETIRSFENYKTGNLPVIRTRTLNSENQKAGYINIAILLYGMLNIGFIIAVAFMK